MIKTTSYRTKRRRVQEQLQVLEWSSDELISESFLVEPTAVLSSQDINNDNNINEYDLSKSISFEQNINSSMNTNTNKSFDDTIYKDTYNDNLSLNDDIHLITSIPPNTPKNNILWEENIKNKLRKFIINFNVPQNTSNALLKFLKNDINLNFLPVDCRTLFQSTSTKILNIREIEPNGIYYHFGLENGIQKYSKILSLDENINIAIGIDGLPLSRSSSSQFWLIFSHIIIMFFRLEYTMVKKNPWIVTYL